MATLQPRHADALRMVNKLAQEYLSTRESLQLIVELAALGDEARGAIEGQESKIAELESEIVRLTSSASTLATAETRSRERAESAASQVAEREGRLSDLDAQIAQKTEALSQIVASITAHKKVLEQV